MTEITIGVRLSMETGLCFFGLAEVNKAIQEGKKVIAIKEGEALFQKVGENEQNVRLVLYGCTLQIAVQE